MLGVVWGAKPGGPRWRGSDTPAHVFDPFRLGHGKLSPALDLVVPPPGRLGGWICARSPAHLPDLHAQAAAGLALTAALPPFLPVLTEAPLGKGWGGLGGQELGAAIDLAATEYNSKDTETGSHTPGEEPA